MNRHAGIDSSRFFQRPSEHEKRDPALETASVPDRLAELEALRDETGAFAVALEGKTIIVNVPDGFSLCLNAPKDPRRLQLYPMVPPDAKFARSVSVLVTDDPGLDELEMRQKRSTDIASFEKPIDRVLNGLRDLILEQMSSDRPARFSVASEIAEIAAKVQGMLVVSVRDAPIHAEVANYLAGIPGPQDNDFANFMRELMMMVKKQSDSQQSTNAERDARGDHMMLMSDIEMIRTMQQNGTSNKVLDARLVLLLKRLEAENATELVPSDVLRGHPPNGAGGQDPS